jgi:acetyl-CoA acyltransferase
MQDAYIVAGYRTAVTKSKKGGFRFTRPDDLAIEVIKGLMADVPQLDAARVDDVIVFHQLTRSELEQVIHIELAEVMDRMKDKKMDLKSI